MLDATESHMCIADSFNLIGLPTGGTEATLYSPAIKFITE